MNYQQYSLPIGTLLNKGAYKSYRIEKILGQGTFGITYLATEIKTIYDEYGRVELTKEVAIKEFFMADFNSRGTDGTTVEGSSSEIFVDYRRKFRREAENLERLSHTNIVKVFDVFDDNDTTYYAMEYIEGSDLDIYIQQCGQLNEPEAMAIMASVGDAVAYMHSQNMLHLDIKPKNIMRESDGTYYLIDFGLSKQFNANGNPDTSTKIGLGTPGYAPIEQATYRKDNTFPATLDIYALGATLFKMLTGQRPPDASSVLNDGFPEQELINKSVSAKVRKAIKRAMAPMRKDRYQTVKEFLEKLPLPTLEETKEKPGKNEVIPENPNPKPVSRLKPVIGWIILICLAICVPTFIIYDITSIDRDSKQSAETVEQLDTVYSTVKDLRLRTDFGTALYSGKVMRIYGSHNKYLAEIDSMPTPVEHGVAKIIDGKYSGCVYDGYFHRLPVPGKLTLQNGDVIEGLFMNGKCDEGRYTIKKNGEYFKGSITSEGKPLNGNWYNKNGELLIKH